MKRTGIWMLLPAVLGMAAAAAGMEITLEQAETAVGNWIARGGGFGELSGGGAPSGETFEDPETGARMHVVRVPGKGFAVTSADDGIEPVVLFSDGDGEFVPEAGSPLWDLLRWDLAARQAGAAAGTRKGGNAMATAARAKWAELLSERREQEGGNIRAANGKRVVSEVHRLLPMTTLWGQRNNSRGEQAYNLYSPRKPAEEGGGATATARTGGKDADSGEEEGEQAPCGCVATAGGQVMKFLGWPTGAVEARQGQCEIWGVPTTLPMKGGVYRWSAMGTVEPSGEGCAEASKLTYDIGVACGASFSNETAMSTEVLVRKMTGVFRYANAAWRSFDRYEPDTFEQGVTTSLDAGVPLLLSLRRSASSTGGHTVVVDGCGKDGGSFAVHINCGWGAKGCNLWYMPPSIHPDAEHEYDFVSGFGYNFIADETGSVVSGIVRGPNGRPVTGGSVTLHGAAEARWWGDKAGGVAGCYVFCAPPGDYRVSASANGAESAEYPVAPKACTAGVMGNVLQDIVIPQAKTVGAVSAATTEKAETGAPAKAPRDAEDIPFAAPFEVRLSSATPGAEIRYTLDGTQPGPESALCEGPIAIQDTTTLRAVAYADGMECSEEFERTWTFDDPQSRDDFADARPLSGASGTSSFDNAGYTKEEEEPLHGDYLGGASAWATWTAPDDGDWTFWLEGTGTNGTSALDTQLAIYTGDALPSLSRVAANDDQPEGGYSSRLSFHAEAGTAYRIAMDTYHGAAGTLRLRWEEGWLHWVVPDYTSRFVPRSGGRHGFRIASSIGWRVVECEGPVEPETMEGADGDDFVFAMTENGTGVERRATITFQSGNSGLAAVTLIQHPSLDFATTKQDALDRAFREDKRILLVRGRETCMNTRGTLFSVIPSAAVKAQVDGGYVLWYSNCDVQTDSGSYASGLGSYTLPLIALLDPQDMSACVARTTGPQTAAGLLALLEEHADWGGILAVATKTLPAATAGMRYETALAASGGTPPYAWGLKGGYAETAADNTFAETGTARGWQGDDACWDLPLPFAFPFFGHSYTNAKINSNGAISFGNDSFTAYAYSSGTFLGTPVVAAFWKDLTTEAGDISVETAGDRVKVTWKGRYYSGGAVAFSATLHADGTIVFSYGAGNASGATIGISAGDGSTAFLSAKSNSGSMDNADDIVFAGLSTLPEGLSLSDGGVLRGTPGTAGTYPFTVVLSDARGVAVTKELSLTVEGAGGGAVTEHTPVPVPHAWLAEHGLGDGTADGCETAAASTAANGIPVWACYVAGLDPTDRKAVFKIKSFSFAGGGEPVIEWDPDLNAGGMKADRTYVEEGKASMADEWGPRDADSRFFRVRVKLPE